MITKPLSLEELKSIWLEIFFNKTDRVTKISDMSALSATAFADSRLAQKAMKDISIIESLILPQGASGSSLDVAGKLFASMDRYTASGSSTYLYIVADPGTVYLQSTVTFSGDSGISFELEEDFTVGGEGFGYAKVRSTSTGAETNVDPNMIRTISNQPSGHIAVTNEFMATGGRDIESDYDFRNRIMSHNNIVSKTTLASLTEVLREFEEDILLLQNLGFNEDGVLDISIVTQNGIGYTVSELNTLLENAKEYFSLSDLNKQGEVIGVTLSNCKYQKVGGNSVGIDFRVDINSGYDQEQVRKNIQIAMSRYLDPRDWVGDGYVEWDRLLRIAQDTEGVKYVPDQHFNPSSDEYIDPTKFPRISKFVMRDLDGNVLSSTSLSTYSPIFYPNE